MTVLGQQVTSKTQGFFSFSVKIDQSVKFEGQKKETSGFCLFAFRFSHSSRIASIYTSVLLEIF